MPLVKDPRSYALIIALLASFLTPFVGSSINIALPVIGRDLGINALFLGWIPTIYLLALAVLLIPMGRISDIYGRKRIFQWGIIIFTIASFLASFSISGEMLLFFRIVQGVGSAMIFGNVSAIVAAVFPVMQRGRALGWAATGAYLGLFLGPPLGGFLTQNLGWQSIFYFNVPLGIFCAYSARHIKEEWREAEGEKFDLKGTLILGTSLILFMMGLSFLPDTSGLIFLVMGLVAGVVFYYFESGLKSPVFNVDLFKNKGFTWNGVAALISYTAAYPIIFLLSFYLQYVLNLNPLWAGLFLSAQPLIIAGLSPYAGRMSDTKNPSKVAAGGMAFIILSLGVFFLLPWFMSIYLVLLGLIFLGLGFALFAAPNSNLVMSSLPEKYFGVAASTITSMRVMGQMLGMGIALLLINLYLGTADIKPDNIILFLDVMQISFIIFAVLSFFGFLITYQGRDRD